MSQVSLQRIPVDVNAEQIRQRIADSHEAARALITWLSFPGTAEKHGIIDAPYLVGMLSVLLVSCAPQDAIRDIDDLVGYVKQTVQAAVNHG